MCQHKYLTDTHWSFQITPTGFTLPYGSTAALVSTHLPPPRFLEKQHGMLFGKRGWESLSVQPFFSQLRIFDELEIPGAEAMRDVVRSRQHVGISEPRVSPALLCKQPSLTAAELGRLPACYTVISISGLGSPLCTPVSEEGSRSTAIFFVGFYLPGFICL